MYKNFSPADFGRIFNEARKDQGFRSQAHLDAFYTGYDHTSRCAECQSNGPAVWLEGSASWQPTMNRCPVGRALDAAEFAMT